MEKFRFFEHTADMKFQAYGRTMEEAFGNAALALFSIVTEPEKISRAITKVIMAEGPDIKSLLYHFLEELLVLLDTENFLLNSVGNATIEKKAKGYSITASAIGDYYSEKYETHGDVKAITYNEMKVEQDKGMFVVQVVPDI